MQNKIQKLKTIVYIDGYNLYYGLRSAYQGKYKWLDLQALSCSFLQESMEIVAVKYFTAITKSNSQTRQRQEVYLKALQAHCNKLEIVYGQFLSSTRRCKSCNSEYRHYEEKQTDVNIVCQVVSDATGSVNFSCTTL